MSHLTKNEHTENQLSRAATDSLPTDAGLYENGLSTKAILICLIAIFSALIWKGA